MYFIYKVSRRIVYFVKWFKSLIIRLRYSKVVDRNLSVCCQVLSYLSNFIEVNSIFSYLSIWAIVLKWILPLVILLEVNILLFWVFYIVYIFGNSIVFNQTKWFIYCHNCSIWFLSIRFYWYLVNITYN